LRALQESVQPHFADEAGLPVMRAFPSRTTEATHKPIPLSGENKPVHGEFHAIESVFSPSNFLRAAKVDDIKLRYGRSHGKQARGGERVSGPDSDSD
jgi:hypothetical protein